MLDILKKDAIRYGGKVPAYQRWYRQYHSSSGIMRFFYHVACYLVYKRTGLEFYACKDIGPGFYIGHAYGITVNPNAVIGKNCNISKGVTIGQENRGPRKGTPVIGDCVWMGVNATIVGAIHIGDDVMIAPNSFVNFDVPSHSIVIGNPAVIKHRDNATEGYINRRVEN